MPVDLSRLTYNDTVTYSTGYAIEGGIEDQDAGRGPYKALVVDIGERLIEVRADGMHGSQPLYIVFTSDILSIEPKEEAEAKQEYEDTRKYMEHFYLGSGDDE